MSTAPGPSFAFAPKARVHIQKEQVEKEKKQKEEGKKNI